MTKILNGSADLTLYTTTIAVDDLDDVRAALGYEQINLTARPTARARPSSI